MATEVLGATPVPWWREPNKDQWTAWVAAWLGWTLDSFDFTIFLLIMLPISQEFGVPLTEVTAVFTITLWMRLVGAVASGWLGDRLGRRLPLMISILGYSLCNFIAGFSPVFWFLFLFRALLGFFMGAEWPAGAALAMEQWPIRSRGFMSGVLQGSWGIGFLLSSAVYGFLYTSIGWRGCLWIGILPALTVVYIRYFVKEPPVWVENRRRQREEHREVHMPLFSIFKRGMIGNTALACWWMAGGLVTYYSINGMFATHLQKDLGLSPAMIATPIIFANLVVFLASMFWGWAGDRIGRRWAMMIPGLLGIPVAFCYMLSADYWVIVVGYVVQGALLGGGAGAHVPSYMNERFPTEVRCNRGCLLLSPGDHLRRSGAARRHVLCAQLQYRVLDPDAGWLRDRRGQLVPRAVSRARDQGQGDGAGPGASLTLRPARRAFGPSATAGRGPALRVAADPGRDKLA